MWLRETLIRYETFQSGATKTQLPFDTVLRVCIICYHSFISIIFIVYLLRICLRDQKHATDTAEEQWMMGRRSAVHYSEVWGKRWKSSEQETRGEKEIIRGTRTRNRLNWIEKNLFLLLPFSNWFSLWFPFHFIWSVSRYTISIRVGLFVTGAEETSGKNFLFCHKSKLKCSTRLLICRPREEERKRSTGTRWKCSWSNNPGQ